MSCDHRLVNIINRTFNKNGKLIECDTQCGICKEMLYHYKLGVKTKRYNGKTTVINKIMNVLLEKVIKIFY